LRDAGHLKNPRVLCDADGTPLVRHSYSIGVAT